MAKKNRLEGKKILIVDDEPDVLETLAELLTACDVVQASSFGAAETAMNDDHFDIAVLDIMGVDGYKLLEIAKKKKIIAVMLTANALSVEDTKKSYESGADLYIPKDEMENIVTFLNDVLEGQEKGKSTWHRWWDRLGWYYDNRFGPEWKYADKDFWDNILEKSDEHLGPPGNP
jgi:CheY-like chemotaxis protein